MLDVGFVEDNKSWMLLSRLFAFCSLVAKSGGVSSTLRVPFQRSLKTTIASRASANSVYWFIIRGLEAMPVHLGDLQLPSSAKLRVYRQENVILKKLEYITLANVSNGISGALLGVKLDSVGATDVGFTYLEACLRLYDMSHADTPMFLSSGMEDHFLSAVRFSPLPAARFDPLYSEPVV